MSDPIFFPTSRTIDVAEIAALTGAKLRSGDDPSTVVSRIAPLATGGSGTLVYIETKKNARYLDGLHAAAILAPEDLISKVPEQMAALVVSRPQEAFLYIAGLLYPGAARPGPLTGETGISEQAAVSRDARLEQGVIVEAGAVIGPKVAIGTGTVIGPNAVIGESCQIGRNCYVGSNASVRCALIGDGVILHDGVRVGQDGFGFVPGAVGLKKVLQIGRVVIQNDVEIGANTAVDRGTMEDTIIGEGTKIDNLVQIAHNVQIGRHCVVAGNCGISGSVVIADGVMLGGGVGIADHVTVGAGAQIAASSGVMHDVPAGEKWAGSPAQIAKNAFREFIAVRELARSRAKRKDSE